MALSNQVLSTLEYLVEAPFNLLDIDIPQDADWMDPFQIVMANDQPFDLTGVLLELYIRPTYNHATLLKKLTSAGSAGIVIDDARNGMAYFSVDRAVVTAEVPIGAWNQFLVMTEAGVTQTEIWRGSMRVHPGKFS